MNEFFRDNNYDTELRKIVNNIGCLSTNDSNNRKRKRDEDSSTQASKRRKVEDGLKLKISELENEVKLLNTINQTRDKTKKLRFIFSNTAYYYLLKKKKDLLKQIKDEEIRLQEELNRALEDFKLSKKNEFQIEVANLDDFITKYAIFNT